MFRTTNRPSFILLELNFLYVCRQARQPVVGSGGQKREFVAVRVYSGNITENVGGQNLICPTLLQTWGGGA